MNVTLETPCKPYRASELALPIGTITLSLIGSVGPGYRALEDTAMLISVDKSEDREGELRVELADPRTDPYDQAVLLNNDLPVVEHFNGEDSSRASSFQTYDDSIARLQSMAQSFVRDDRISRDERQILQEQLVLVRDARQNYIEAVLHDRNLGLSVVALNATILLITAIQMFRRSRG